MNRNLWDDYLIKMRSAALSATEPISHVAGALEAWTPDFGPSEAEESSSESLRLDTPMIRFLLSDHEDTSRHPDPQAQEVPLEDVQEDILEDDSTSTEDAQSLDTRGRRLDIPSLPSPLLLSLPRPLSIGSWTSLFTTPPSGLGEHTSTNATVHSPITSNGIGSKRRDSQSISCVKSTTHFPSIWQSSTAGSLPPSGMPPRKKTCSRKDFQRRSMKTSCDWRKPFKSKMETKNSTSTMIWIPPTPWRSIPNLGAQSDQSLGASQGQGRRRR